jgi:hypothetical protein
MSALYANVVEKPNQILWMFAAPDDTALVNATLWRAARTSVAGGAYTWVVDTDALPHRWLEWCTDYQQGCRQIGSLDEPLAPGNRVNFTDLHARYLFAHLDCNGLDERFPCSHPNGAEAKIFGSRIGLLDQVSPLLGSQLEGTLLDSTVHQEGIRSLSFSATDRGGGIAAVGLIADGRVVLVRPPDPGDARCR